MREDFVGAVGLNKIARFRLDPHDQRGDADFYELIGDDNGVFGCQSAPRLPRRLPEEPAVGDADCISQAEDGLSGMEVTWQLALESALKNMAATTIDKREPLAVCSGLIEAQRVVELKRALRQF